MDEETGMDMLKISDLLLAADVSFDSDGPRLSGMILMLEIHYTHNFWGKVHRYEYRVSQGTPRAELRTATLLSDTLAEVVVRSGLKILVRQTGVTGSATLL